MLRQLMFLFVLVLTFVPTAVTAQSPTAVQEAREHFSRGQMAFEQSRWLDCATHFEQSFQAIFAPELLYNIGLCYERAADTAGSENPVAQRERALQAYSRYLRELPEASDATAIQIRVSDLRMRLEREREAIVVEPDPVVPEVPVIPEADPTPLADDFDTDPVIAAPVLQEPSDQGFGFGWTVTGAAFTLAAVVTAVGLSVAAQEQFNHLANTCGQTPAGCAPGDVESVVTLATGANALYVVSGILLAATGTALGLELHFWSSPNETSASVGYSQVF